MLNEKLTQEEATWLLETFQPKRKQRVSGVTMDKYFVPARAAMLGKQVDRPGCACQFKSYVMMTNSMFDQHYEAIKLLSTPKVKTNGAKSKKILNNKSVGENK